MAAPLAHPLLEPEALTVSLFTHLVGEGHPRFVFLHGLFGQGRNWSLIAKGLADDGASLLVDLPNHGRSPWTDDFSYIGMADAVAGHLDDRLGPAAHPVVIGHSMGGKTAMVLALRRPDLVRGLVVVDIAPDDTSHGYGFGRLIAALRALDVDAMTSRDEADAALAASVPDADVRAFLLQNLHRRKRGFTWHPNLALLARDLPLISGFPQSLQGSYPGPVLWLRGAESGYVREDHIPVMRRLFPAHELVTVPKAGHWVHSDAPASVVYAIHEFVVRHRLVPVGGPIGPS